MLVYYVFNGFLLVDAEGPVALELPNQWLWNIIDEFIYQFQAFSQFRSKLSKKVCAACGQFIVIDDNINIVLNVLSYASCT